MKTYKSIEELQADSIKVEPEMKCFYPHLMYESKVDVDIDTVTFFNNCYALSDSIIAFIINNEFYVTPYTQGALIFLISAEFHRRTFCVPFSNGDFPKDNTDKWINLLYEAALDAEEVFAYDCHEWCDNHGIGAIDDSILAKCFIIPKNGVTVHSDYEDVYYPAISNQKFDSIAIERLGTFYFNNGIVSFVYRDGQTYVAKGYNIIWNLQNAGYKMSGLFVPFSYGEEIVDVQLANLWKSLPII